MSLSITPRLVIDAAVEAGWEYELIDESKGFYILKNGDKHYYLKGMRSYKSGSVNDWLLPRTIYSSSPFRCRLLYSARSCLSSASSSS